MWTPWKRNPKADPLKEEEAGNDELRRQLRELRERLLEKTVSHTVEGGDDDR